MDSPAGNMLGILVFSARLSGEIFLAISNNSTDKNGLKFLFRALRHRNYRLFFGGQGVSLIGTWMQTVAMSWMVYRITGSALILGYVELFGGIPAFFLTPFVGVLADRWNRHRMVIVIQTLAMLQAFVVAYLALSGNIQVWQIILLSVVMGVINSFDIPVRQSFIMDMLESREDIGNAIALNSSMFNLSRLIGPSIAGILIAAVGEGVCFLINGISYLAVIVALLMMRIKPIENIATPKFIWHEIKEGFSYTFGFLPSRAILLLLILMSLVGMPYAVLMPVMAKDVLLGGSYTYGFLTAAVGIGALIGAYYLASRKSVQGLEKVIPVAGIIFSLGVMLFSFSRIYNLSLFILIFCGFGLMVQMASSNTVLQTITDDDKRGRVMSYFALAFRGTAPFAGLLAGAMADKVGAPLTIRLGGLCCLFGAVFFLKRTGQIERMIQPIYRRKGITN